MDKIAMDQIMSGCVGYEQDLFLTEAGKVRLSTKILVAPLYFTPRFLKRFICHAITMLWVYVLKIRFKETLGRVQLVYPEMPLKEQKTIVYKSFYNLLLVLFEYSYFAYKGNPVLKLCTFKGEEHLQSALAKGKGVFIVAAHTGNGEMAVYGTCLKGYPLHLIAKRVGTPFIDKILFELREAAGVVHIPPKNSAPLIIETVQKGLPIVYLQDQFSYPPKGVPSTFLGVSTYTNASLAYLVMKSGAAVIPVKTYRGDKDTTVVEFMPPVETKAPFATQEENIAYMTQQYNFAVEEGIKEHLGDWMWIHRRWKKRPPPEATIHN